MNADHNYFDYFDDITYPINTFLSQCEISVKKAKNTSGLIRIPSGLFEAPPSHTPY